MKAKLDALIGTIVTVQGGRFTITGKLFAEKQELTTLYTVLGNQCNASFVSSEVLEIKRGRVTSEVYIIIAE